MNVTQVSIPPTEQELEMFTPLEPERLPRKYTREINHRIFVNRSVNLDNIQYIGFDMDYTLAVYNPPAYEALSMKLTIDKLIKRGYPKEIAQLQYNDKFAIRGLFLDKKHGNLLHLDHFGFILSCVHGFEIVRKDDNRFAKWYPDRVVHPSDIGKRFYCFDTLFGVPEAYLYASLVNYFEKSDNQNILVAEEEDRGVEISYWSLFDDVRESTHEIHIDGSLKLVILSDLNTYIRRDDRLALMLDRFRTSGKKLFLLTNSEYYYTEKVMDYLLPVTSTQSCWRDHFDIIITNACKPRFFLEGSTLREINLETGAPKFASVPNQFQKGKVYAGGNFALFKKLTETQGSEVMYVGDNIMHDIIQTKRSRCLWRTLLIVREIEQEINTWNSGLNEWNRVINLEYLRAKTYQNMDSSETEAPNDSPIKKHIALSSEKMDAEFNVWFGSLFRRGTSESFFSNQVKRFADLYASDCCNLLSYPSYYYFSSLPQLLPHEIEALQNARQHHSNNNEQ